MGGGIARARFARNFRTTEFHSFGDSAIRCSTASKLRNLSYYLQLAYRIVTPSSG